MDRHHSLSGRKQFLKLYREGISWSGRGLRIRYLLASGEEARFAVAVPRAIGKAVLRNRIRRVIREAVRLRLGEWPGGLFHIRVTASSGRPTRSSAQEQLDSFVASLQR